MKILEHTPDRLVIEENPVLLGCILAIAILIPAAIGLAMLASGGLDGFWMLGVAAFFGIPFVVFLRRVRVIFDRSAGTVIIRTASLLGQSEAHAALADIRKIEVETSISQSDSQGRQNSVSYTHRAVLHLPDRVVPLTEVYSGGNGAELTAETIRLWLGRDPETD